jgi:hypothetical protein
MRYDDPFEAWKHTRARAAVPLDFAGRVMTAIGARHARRGGRLAPLLLSPAVRISIASLACAACLMRILQVIALFLVGQPSM